MVRYPPERVVEPVADMQELHAQVAGTWMRLGHEHRDESDAEFIDVATSGLDFTHPARARGEQGPVRPPSDGLGHKMRSDQDGTIEDDNNDDFRVYASDVSDLTAKWGANHCPRWLRSGGLTLASERITSSGRSLRRGGSALESGSLGATADETLTWARRQN